MGTVLGLFGILVWIIGVIALAAGITFAVIRLSPGEKPGAPSSQSTESSS